MCGYLSHPRTVQQYEPLIVMDCSRLAQTPDMCFEFLKYLQPRDLFSCMKSCRLFNELIHSLKLLQPFASGGLDICERNFEKYEYSCLSLLNNFHQSFSQDQLFKILQQALRHSRVDVMYTVFGFLDVTSFDICTFLTSREFHCSLHHETTLDTVPLFMQHPKVQDVLSEIVEYLVSEGKFTLLDTILPDLDLSQYFHDIVDASPTILADHPSLLFQFWKKRRERRVIVNNFASIFSYFQCSNYDVALDLLERMNKKERQAQRDWVSNQCNEFHLALFRRHNLFHEYGLDILNTHLECHHHNIVLKCLKANPEFISNEMDLQRFSLDLIEYGQYYLLADLIKVLKTKAITAIATSPRNYLRFLFKHCLPLGSKTNYLGRRDSKLHDRRCPKRTTVTCSNVITITALE
ncbi:hypothetical protein C9374_005261 [Naegleria lovaniensis]|uniref:F-box domain-containing protein n=1 Tax=Naegleria lovaniensis TaxID=51637 RepID=A0AA88GKK0_NAELO|nr:uncharacterized protein C9374_005261 [Naegleria lovaniensis]KAG2382681.1 hypothetical protein C9374_005261 [Naegleria lovaniensis]